MITIIYPYKISYFLLLILFVAALTGSFQASAKEPIHDYRLSPALFENNSIHIQAIDETGNEDSRIKGHYPFIVNGFEKRLLFIDGKAAYPDNLKGSAFLYMKYENPEKPVPRLFFVYRSDAGLVPVKISLFWLLAIPLGLVVLSFLFRRLIIIAVILIVLFFVFNKGLSVSRYAGALSDWVQSHI